ncbi:Oxygen-independent coproporphyrinogen-III oxidase-like protein YggW [Candidatus Syntrophocurvum alkaliphilum]|uniref:Heme chaperone HemW n=1 Tax=Candidatus Syntrophocurvum alkaliphilum TaxID=2293317 RepID=A0A6I6DI96_9FIRM|nr:radical SAM family heme chaperone HemW [Candidatus Syntrophocurvum alkaliphilum]QGU00001.1 Oxygen-independent coproporphyrinogen-III oxidase-like protein YggW [Candidatus Syntrophocurvum alkaliphilum]
MIKETKKGIYIHIPFCVQKCFYCDFYSVSLKDEEILNDYLKCLIYELKTKSQDFSYTSIESIYIGGGTPSLLSSDQLNMMLNTIKNYYKVDSNSEITMEANPQSLDLTKLISIKQAGVNRISLGVQSFFSKELELLGRIHSTKDIYNVVENLHKTFDNFNIDLIYGLPNQSLNDWIKNLKLAIDCSPKHISTYLLQLEPNTVLGKKVEKNELQLLDQLFESQMYYKCIEYLQSNSFKHYEISNFACSGFESKHNLIYWDARYYLGFGAGAVSFIDNKRIMNETNYINYIDQVNKTGRSKEQILETMTEDELLVDAIILGLRKTKGINRSDFLNRFNQDILVKYKKIIDKCIENNLLNYKDGYLFLTKEGYFLSNSVFCQFLG